jgi:hypothetical protein
MQHTDSSSMTNGATGTQRDLPLFGDFTTRRPPMSVTERVIDSRRCKKSISDTRSPTASPHRIPV